MSECGKQLSQYAEACPSCGFPIRKFIEEHNFTDLIQTDIGKEEWHDFAHSYSELDEIDDKQIELAKQYGHNQFEEKIFNERTKKRDEEILAMRNPRPVKTTPTNTPKCPTCGSTNIQRIGAVERGASVLGLGLFSKKINKTFKCNSCMYTW